MSKEFVIYVSTVYPDGKVQSHVGFPTYDKGIDQLSHLTDIVQGGDIERHLDKGYSVSKGEKLHVVGRVNRSSHVKYQVRGYLSYPQECFAETYDTYGEALARTKELNPLVEVTHHCKDTGTTRCAHPDGHLPHYYIEPVPREKVEKPKAPTWTLYTYDEDGDESPYPVKGYPEGHNIGQLTADITALTIEFEDGSSAIYEKE